jgi:hypothetical protein
MTNSGLSSIYLGQLNLLTEDLYRCWFNSFCNETKILNQEKLRRQISSYGIFKHNHKFRKKLPSTFSTLFRFKTLRWVNKFTDKIDENSFRDYSELNGLVLDAIRGVIDSFDRMEDKVVYANRILCDLDRAHVHKLPVDESVLTFRFKELFEQVLSHHFIDPKSTGNNQAVTKNYELSIRLIAHLDFIDRLIELFSCSNIDLLDLAINKNCSLFVFEGIDSSFMMDPATSMTNYERVEAIILEHHYIPRFSTTLSPNCMIAIMRYLYKRGFLLNTDIDTWLYWFDLHEQKIPRYIHWKGSPTLLSNIIQHLTGNCFSKIIKMAFSTNHFVNPTYKEYLKGSIYKDIERIIVISKQTA